MNKRKGEQTTMNGTKTIATLSLLLGMAVMMVPARAAVVVPEEIKAEINQVVRQEARAYDVDVEKSKALLSRVDSLFEARVDVKKAISRTSRQGTRQSFRRTLEKNTALSAEKEDRQTKALAVSKAFDIFYVKKPMQRSFKKDIIHPVTEGLEEDEVIALGKKFIQTRQLCPIADNDGLGPAVVVDRKRRALDEKNQKEVVVSQKVSFTRSFQGLEVINARQSVEVHPETREILGYKIKDWGVIKTNSEKKQTAPQSEEVMRVLQDNFKKSTRTFQAHKIKTGYYQTETKLVPVMLVYFDIYEAKEEEAIPEEEVLIVSLAKDIDLPTRDKKRRAPKAE